MTIHRVASRVETTQHQALRMIPTLTIRCLWAALIALHIAPLSAVSIDVFEGGATWGRVGNGLVLVAAIVFFALKVLGVPLLPIRNRLSVIVFFLVCAITHAGMRPSVQAEELVAQLPTAVAAAVILEAIKRSSRTLARVGDQLRSDFVARPLQARCHWLTPHPISLRDLCGTISRDARAPPR
jgi:hypothetical protein